MKHLSRTCGLFSTHFLGITLSSLVMVTLLLTLFHVFLFFGILCSCEIPLISSGHIVSILLYAAVSSWVHW